MGDVSVAVPGSLSDVIEKLIGQGAKNAGGESAVVADEKLLITREPCPEILLPTNQIPLPSKPSEIIVVQRFSQQNKRLLSVEEPERHFNFEEKKNSTPAPKRAFSDELDVTGSPLKCPFMLDDNTAEISPFSVSLACTKKKKNRETVSYTPLSAVKAGLIASKFNCALRKVFKDAADSIPVWIVCDGKDVKGTLFYGLHHTSDEATRTVVTSSGPYDSFDSLPSLDHLKSQHVVACPTKRVDSFTKATYNVASSEQNEGASEQSSMKLTCTWRSPLNILTPPSLDAHTTACVEVVCSDQRSAAYQMYQELSVLRGFVLGLSSGEVSWFVREDESSSVAEDIDTVFTTIREKAQRQKKEEDGVSNFDKMVEEKFYSCRQNMDFTDLLWSVLMKCESYQDLTRNLEVVFKAISTGRVRPQIHVRNKTQIGILSRSLMRGQSEEPILTGITPLQMLVEIGIEKIKRDYINIFQAGELVTGDQLSWFVNNADESLETMLDLLEKLLVGLQVSVIMRTYLNLPPASLAHLTAQALNQLKEGEASASYIFDFKLETGTVLQFLNSFTPATWEVTLESIHEKYSKWLVAHISQQPLIRFPNLNSDFEELMEDNDKDVTEEVEERYYCCFFTIVKDKTFL